MSTAHQATQGASQPGQQDLPQFASVMRGYDRGQVDDYVARLNDFLDDAEQRATRAERSLADALRRNERLTDELRGALERQQQPAAGGKYDGLGERVETILRLAAEEADAVREEGRREAAELVDAAKRAREEEVRAGEHELAAVAQRRDGVVAELRKVQDALATLGLRPMLDDELTTDAHADEPAAPADTDELTTDPGADATEVIDLRAAERAGVAG